MSDVEGGEVVQVLRDAAPDREVEAVVGGLATACVAVAMLRRSTPSATPSAGPATATPRPGNHRS